jgi:hypothetical protein
MALSNFRHTTIGLSECHSEGELIAAPLLADSARLTYSTKTISKMTPVTPKDSLPIDVTRFHRVLASFDIICTFLNSYSPQPAKFSDKENPCFKSFVDEF